MSASLAKRCVEVKGKLQNLRATIGDETDSITAEDVGDLLDRFLLWAGNLGALRSPTSKLSLDHRLADAPEVRQQILQQFCDIDEAADDLKAIILNTRPNRRISFYDSNLSEVDGDEEHTPASEAGSDSDDEAHMTLEIIAESIKTLFRIAILVRKSTPGDRFSKALQLSKSSFPDSFDIDHVRHKHPKLEHVGGSAPAGRLGRAIAKRRQVIKYGRDHRTRLALDDHRETAPEVGGSTLAKQAPRASDRASAPALTEMVSSKATTFYLQTEGLPDSLSPGQGQEDDEEEDDDISVMTASTTTDNLAALKLPRLDDLSVDGAPFECHICFVIHSFTKERAWKAHAFQDLKAYLCTVGDEKCDEMAFGDRNAWFEHEMQHHRSHFVCPLCDRGPFSPQEALQSHFDEHHGSFSSEQLTRLQSAGQQAPQSFKAQDCPFCDDWAEALQRKHGALRQPEHAFEYTVTADRFKRHVAMHQEQLAIFAIPRATGGDGTPDSGSVIGSLSSRDGFESDAEWGSEPSNTAADVDEVLEMDTLQTTDTYVGVPETLNIQERLVAVNADVAPRRHPDISDAENRDVANNKPDQELFGKYIVRSSQPFASVRAICLSYDINPYVDRNSENHFLVSFSSTTRMLSTRDHLRDQCYELEPWEESLETEHVWSWERDEVSRVLVLACALGQRAFFLWMWEEYKSQEPRANIETIGFLEQTLMDVAAPEMRPLLLQMGCLPKPRTLDSSPLLSYAAAHNEELVASLLENGFPATPEALLERYANTPLHVAASGGHPGIVTRLIDAGAIINRPDWERNTPLHVAVKAGHGHVVRRLLECGADINGQGIYGCTPLHLAVKAEHTKVILQLLELRADVNIKNLQGRTALAEAAAVGPADNVSLLLEKGADLHARDHIGRTPLFDAAEQGHLDVIRILLAAGCHPSVTDRAGKTALGTAAREGHLAATEALMDAIIGTPEMPNSSGEQGRNWSEPVCQAVIGGSVDIVRMFLRRLDSDAFDQLFNGMSPLMHAVIREDEVVAELLLQGGCSPNVRNNQGETALFYAATGGRETMVKLLLDAGGNASIEDKSGNTAIDVARGHGHDIIVEMLSNSCGPSQKLEVSKEAGESQHRASEYAFKCFFSVRDPAGTARPLMYYSACNSLFPSVNRLR